MAKALGLPPAALKLVMPDKTEANPRGKVATFLEKWAHIAPVETP